MSALIAIAAAQLALFVVVCGAILLELRWARLEAERRGERGKELLEAQQEIELVLEEEVRRIRKGNREAARQGSEGDGT